jgi:two-component system, NarL family, invasion response regulator UvrY|tara:strand:- start:5979 stop:6596 length:618 start_codon:yes stop_codon:yes gene_type:complete
MIKLILVDDHDIVRAGLKRLLENQDDINIMGDFGNGETAYKFIRKNEVDVIIMDLSMPGKGGIESTRQIKKHFPKINILILSMHDNSTMAQKVIDAGATGYILKNDIAEDLINAVYSVSNSESVFSKSIKKSLEDNSEDKFSKLNDKELEILKSLAKGNNLKNIANDINISYKTAANYQTSIKQKLELKTSIDLFQIAKDNNLIE